MLLPARLCVGSLVACLSAIAGLAITTSTDAAPPQVRFIPPSPGYPDAFGDGVSADGRTVMINVGTLETFTTSATGRWSDDRLGGTLVMIANPPGAAVCFGRGISDDGRGILAEAAGEASTDNACWSWSEGNGWSRVDALSGDLLYVGPSSTGAAAIAWGGPQLLRAVWTSASGITELFSLGDVGDVRGLSADGSVAVGWYNGAPSRWTASSGWQPLSTGRFDGYAIAHLCSAEGRTIAGFGREPGDWVDHLWWWEESRGRIEWITPPQFELPHLRAMASSGRAVVGSVARNACLVTRENGVIDLNVYLSAQSVGVEGRWLWAANAVAEDADGTLTIVGTAAHGDAPGPAHTEAFVLTMRPCPADVGSAGGTPGGDGFLDNNDLVAFIDQFFSRIAVADRAGPGAASQPDGQFDANDFVVFIDQFFAGC